MPYRLIAFDFDGTLADSLDCFLAALTEASRMHGFRDATPELRPALRGMSAREIIRALEVPMWKVPSVTIDMRRLMRPRIAHVKLFPGVDATFDALVARGIRIAIATSNTEDIVRDRLGPHASRCVDTFACGIPLFGKARRLRALVREAGMQPDDVLYVGDEIAMPKRRAVRASHSRASHGVTRPPTRCRRIARRHCCRISTHCSIAFDGVVRMARSDSTHRDAPTRSPARKTMKYRSMKRR